MVAGLMSAGSAQALTLSGVAIFSTKSSGAAAYGEVWTTAPTFTPRVFLASGSTWVPFQAVELRPGTHRVRLAFDGPLGNFRYGAAVHLDGRLDPSLASVNRAGSAGTEATTIVGARIRRVDGQETWSPDAAVTLVGGHHVRLSEFSVRAVSTDAVGPSSHVPNGRTDVHGDVTLVVAPEPGTAMAWGVAAWVGQRFRRGRRPVVS